MLSENELRKILGPELSAEVSWPANDSPLPDNPMSKIFHATENVHKTAHFIEVYDSVFAPYRDRPITMLEIGVACGGSIEMWRNYFSPEATIVGVDGNPQCTKFDDPGRKVHIRKGQQQNIDFLRSLVEEFGPFDIILDDGSHLPSYTLKTFRQLFLNGLKEGGVYLVEDLEWCYMPCGREPFVGERDANDGTPTFTEIAKALIDVMHSHYRDAESTDLFQEGRDERLSEVTVPLATTLISKIEMYDGIVAIHRKTRELPRLIFKTGDEFLQAWLAEDERLRGRR